MGLNLRSKILFDNQEVIKGTKDSKAAVKEFTKTSEGFVDQFAGLFGVSMGQISGSVKAFQGGIVSLSGAQKGATVSTGLFSGALKILKFALAATGIGLLVVALGSLVAYFTKSQDGADKLARIMEPLKLAFALVTDAAAAIGRAIVGAFENPKEAISKLWEFLKNQFINRLTGFGGVLKSVGNLLISVFKFDGAGIKTAFADVQNYAKQTLTGLNEQQRQNVIDSFKGTKAELAAKLDASNKLIVREQKLEKDRIEFIKRRADLEAAIAKQEEIAANKEEYNAEQRLAAQKKAIDLTKVLYSEEARLAKELLDTTTIRDDLAENMNSDNENAANAYRGLVNLQTQQSNSLKTLFKKQSTLTSEVEKEREEKEKILAIELKRNEILPKLPTIEVPSLTVPITFPTADEIRKNAGGITEVTTELEGQFLDFSGIIGSGISSLGESLGELFASGDVQTFSDSLLSAIGGLLKQLGGMILAAGLGMKAFKVALESLNPYVAIAAGTALIAMGALVSSSIKGLGSSIAGGGGAVSGGGSVNTVSTNAANLERQTLSVIVSGELKAKGNTLIGVISNENKRRGLAT